VRRLVAIGGPLGVYATSVATLESDEDLTPAIMQCDVPNLVALRKRQMTHPEQWDQLIRDLDAMYHQPVWVKQDEIRAIKAPTLLMAGDRTRPARSISPRYSPCYLMPRWRSFPAVVT
jgi:hypothetical protein